MEKVKKADSSAVAQSFSDERVTKGSASPFKVSYEVLKTTKPANQSPMNIDLLDDVLLGFQQEFKGTIGANETMCLTACSVKKPIYAIIIYDDLGQFMHYLREYNKAGKCLKIVMQNTADQPRNFGLLLM